MLPDLSGPASLTHVDSLSLVRRNDTKLRGAAESVLSLARVSLIPAVFRSRDQRRHFRDRELHESLFAQGQAQVLVCLSNFLVAEGRDLTVQESDRRHDEANLDAVSHDRHPNGDASERNAEALALVGVRTATVG